MKEIDFAEYITGLTTGFSPVLGGIPEEDYAQIDLSSGNPVLASVDLTSMEAFSEFMKQFLKETGRKVAIGGYMEIRKLYERSELFNDPDDPDNSRNIHMGMDLWADLHTPVLAVLDGKIHSLKDNDNFGDYGPTVILEHQVSGHRFYTLYGHLSKRSLEGLKVGQVIKGGTKLAELGGPSENGDYFPHLHFQIIQDMKGEIGDFPGVVSKNELEEYIRLCPDPNLLLKIKP